MDPLDGEQAAPPAYLIASKASAASLGGGERALRFPSLLASLAALLVFLRLALGVLSERSAFLAVALFALLLGLVQYGAELKPYAVDAFLAVVLLLLFKRARSRRGWRGWGPLALMGAITPWLSFPSVFVLAGGGLVLGRVYWRNAALSKATPILVGSVWLLSFVALWSVTTSEVAGEDAFAQYWQNACLPIPPTAARDLGLLARAPFDLFGAGFSSRYAHATGDFASYLGAMLVCGAADRASTCGTAPAWADAPFHQPALSASAARGADASGDQRARAADAGRGHPDRALAQPGWFPLLQRA